MIYRQSLVAKGEGLREPHQSLSCWGWRDVFFSGVDTAEVLLFK